MQANAGHAEYTDWVSNGTVNSISYYWNDILVTSNDHGIIYYGNDDIAGSLIGVGTTWTENIGNNQQYQYRVDKIEYTNWSAPPVYYGLFNPVPNDTNFEKYTTEGISIIPGGGILWPVYISTRVIAYYEISKRLRTYVIDIIQYMKRSATLVVDSPGTYKRRTKTWVDYAPGTDGSGSVSAVSSVNNSFTSFSVNTSGISLVGDGSHSHTISIPISGSSNENGHTHTVSASGTADINVSGSTASGGIHSHTFDFKTNRDLYLLDLLGNLTTVKVPIASETTVKNRQMRIWRRTA